MNIKYGLEDKAEIIETDAVFVDIDGERKYFNEVLKTPEGIYLPLDKFIEIYTGDSRIQGDSLIIDDLKFEDSHYKLILNKLNKLNRVIDRNKDGQIYCINKNSYNIEDNIITLNNDITSYSEILEYKDSVDYLRFNNENYVPIGIINKLYKFNTINKPIMIKYAAEKNGYKVVQNKYENYIDLIKDNKIEKRIIYYFVFKGRAFVGSHLFKANLGWQDINIEPQLGDMFETREDAELAIGSMEYGKNSNYVYIIKEINQKYVISNDIYTVSEKNDYYYKVKDNRVFKQKGTFLGGFFSPTDCDMSYVMNKSKNACCNNDFNKNGREIFFPDIVKGIVNGKERILTPNDNWGILGNGNYKGKPIKDENGRYRIAVGAKILIPDYPDDGKMWRDDFNDCSKRINVVIVHKTSKKIKTIECIVADYKAHTYNKYPDGHKHITGDIASFEIENGIIQTGLSYPNSYNAGQSSSCSVYNIDGSIIEFCSDKKDFNFSDYRLIKVIVINE